MGQMNSVDAASAVKEFRIQDLVSLTFLGLTKEDAFFFLNYRWTVMGLPRWR